MICAKVVSNTLQVIDLAPGEACQFVTLLQQSDFANPEAFLTKEIVFTLLSAAAGVYGLVFVINISLRQLGFRG
ncbi:hypothetical protein L4C39_19465 [Vibrio clamense]|uniref:hypothetical protein n=1 Tax=Vibrio clamense TaxID=2910254 RepID=UPI003D1CF1F3